MISNINLPGTLIYECGRCKKKVKGIKVEEATHALNAIVSDDLKYFKKHNMNILKLNDIHFCEDGHVGILKLIGCELVYDNSRIDRQWL